MKRFISLVMVMVMLLSFGIGAFAEVGVLNRLTDEKEEIELLKEVIFNMNEEEKALFLMMIQSSVEEQKIYKANIDRNYKINYSLERPNPYAKMNGLDGLNSNTMIGVQSITVNLNYFNSQITALGLPTTAVMLFKAFGASLAASVADGPLPFGDIVALLTGTIAIAYVAANWDTIGPQWDSIVRIYTTTFSMVRASVSRALSDFKEDVQIKIVVKEVSRAISNRKDKDRIIFYRAGVNYRVGAFVYSSSGPISVETAAARIMSGNDVYCTDGNIAAILASAMSFGGRARHERGNKGEADHYHADSPFSKSHIFYGYSNIIYK